MHYLLAADTEWWMPFVPVLGGAALIAVVSGAVAMVLLLRDVRVYVLPHFLPPGPGEEDVSLPAQVAHIKADIAPTNGDKSSISARVDKAKKLAQGVAQDLIDSQERVALWQAEARGQFTKLDKSIGTVHRRIDFLADGNPEVRRPRNRVVIPTPPEFDADTAPGWTNAAFTRDLSAVVVLDMQATTFCDSQGVNALAKLAHAVNRAGGTLRTINVADAPRRVIEITRLSDLLGVES